MTLCNTKLIVQRLLYCSMKLHTRPPYLKMAALKNRRAKLYKIMYVGMFLVIWETMEMFVSDFICRCGSFYFPSLPNRIKGTCKMLNKILKSYKIKIFLWQICNAIRVDSKFVCVEKNKEWIYVSSSYKRYMLMMSDKAKKS